MKKIYRIGAINWDNSLPSDTYFGFHASRVESPEKYRFRVPYYADIGSDGEVSFHRKSKEEFDRELSLAIDAGIDYFAYTWYSEERPAESECEGEYASINPHVWELNHARKLHKESILREKIKMCAILICLHPYSEKDFRELAGEMKMPYYETVSGRPLVCIFGGYRAEVIARLRAFPKDFGTKEPYIVFYNNGPGSPNGDYSGADSVSDYACTSSARDFGALVEGCITANEKRKVYGLKILPLFTMGWDPTPRIENVVPWTSYPQMPYSSPASVTEYKAGAKRFADWMTANAEYISDHINVFAWNEFEEGGYICPTLTEDGKTDTAHLEAFKEIVKIWQDEN